MSSHFPNLLSEEREKQIDNLLLSIEHIARAVDLFNDQLRAAGNPTPPISIRHKGKEITLFFGQTSVDLDLRRLKLLHQSDRFNLCFPAKQERRAA